MNRERLLNVARALRESPDPSAFDMEQYGSSCGTPGCAFGHYARRVDLQDDFMLSMEGYVYDSGQKRQVHYDDPLVLNHFEISEEEAWELFHGDFAPHGFGCGGAKTVGEAIAYIEEFVKQRTY